MLVIPGRLMKIGIFIFEMLAEKLAVNSHILNCVDNLINNRRFDWLLFSCIQMTVHFSSTSVAGSISSIHPDTQATIFY
jgi:hypothetical protein